MALLSKDIDLTRLSVVDAVAITALWGPPICGMGTAIGACLLGAVGCGIGGRLGVVGALAGGALATAAVGVFIPCVFSRSVKPLLGTVFLFLLAFLFAFLLNWYIPPRFEWLIYRWALAGAGAGVFIGGLRHPIWRIREGSVSDPGKAWIVFAMVLAVAAIIKIVNRGRLGSSLAGAISGALGGLFIGSFAGAFGGTEAEQAFGSYLAIPLSGVALGALGGGGGGWKAWSIAGQGKAKTSENSVSDHFPA